MRIYKSIWFAIAAMTFAACSTDEIGNLSDVVSFSEATVSLNDAADTRAYLDEQNQVIWETTDAIGIYSDVQGVERFIIKEGSAGNAIASFTGNTLSGSKFG